MSQEEGAAAQEVSSTAQGAVLFQSLPIEPGTAEVKGYDFNNGLDFEALLKSFATTGFQATSLSQAITEINRMLAAKRAEGCTIFLGFTSNMISSGVREIIKYICQHKLVDAIVTTGGGVEEDFIKCLSKKIGGSHFLGSFALKGEELRKKGHNRLGNLLVPNLGYCSFEDWLMPIFRSMHKEQKTTGNIFSPSKIINRLGKEINDEDSVWYWCYKNDIPVFSPAMTDGSIGDMMYFYDYNHPGFVCDILQDVRRINDIATDAVKSGMVILGGGLIKHHICNANLMRNGADFSVFINTGVEYDGSDSGAKPDEAVSWGKIKLDAKPVKVWGDASIIFPLVAAATFVKHVEATKAAAASAASADESLAAATAAVSVSNP